MAGALLQMADAVVDVALRLPRLPTRGQEALASAWSSGASGGGVAMQAAKRAGLTVRYGGYLGGGPNGAVIRRALEAEGIEILRKPDPAGDQPARLVMIEPDGVRTTVSGPERAGAEASLERVKARRGDIVLIDGAALARESAREAMLLWLGGLPARATLVFDPGSAAARIPRRALTRILDRADWVTMDAPAAAALTGETSADEAALQIDRRAATARGVLLRRGGEGCLLALRGEPHRRVPGVALGAGSGGGDVHTGAFHMRLMSMQYLAIIN